MRNSHQSSIDFSRFFFVMNPLTFHITVAVSLLVSPSLSQVPVINKSAPAKKLSANKPVARTFHLFEKDESSENDILSERNVPPHLQNYFSPGADKNTFNYETLMGMSQNQFQQPSFNDKVSFTSPAASRQPIEQGSHGESLSYPNQNAAYTYPPGYMDYYPHPQYKLRSPIDSIDTRQGAEAIGAAGGGILAALSGLLGIKGLKASLPFLLAVPFAPLIIPVFLGSLILIALPVITALLFIPIPVIVTPADMSGRSGTADTQVLSLLTSSKVVQMKTALPNLLADVLQGDECLERISCEVGRMSRKLKMDDWVKRLSDKLPKDNIFASRITTGLNETLKKLSRRQRSSVSKNGTEVPIECGIFLCHVKEILKSHILQEN